MKKMKIKELVTKIINNGSEKKLKFCASVIFPPASETNPLLKPQAEQETPSSSILLQTGVLFSKNSPGKSSRSNNNSVIIEL